MKSVGGIDARVTLENTAPGTPHYMAPEALQNPDTIDARSDIYALGATAYFLLTGNTVFDGSLADVLAKLLRDAPAAPSARLGRPLPSALEALVLAALAKRPDDRPESVDAFHTALTGVPDMPAWRPADAEGWWKERGRRIQKARSGDAESSPPRTLDVERPVPER